MDRTRRLRSSEALRSMVRENHVRVEELIYPVFVIEGENIVNPVASMPEINQYSPDRVMEEVDRVIEAGIKAVLLFGIPAYKDEAGSGAYAEDGIVPKAIRLIKAKYPELIIIADVCLCEYTSHGHCGLVQDGIILNDETLPLLAKAAVTYVKAGADVIAPSDMIAIVSMEVKIGDAEGFMNMCLPYFTLEDVMDNLNTKYWYSTMQKDEADYEEHIESLIKRIDVPVKAVLGQSQVSVNDFLHLQIGDIIRLDTNVESEMDVYVGNIKKFTALPGSSKDKYAVRVTSIVREGE